MFGYVRPLTAELKVKEEAFYKSVYCGLCRANGKVTGTASRFALNYDLVFLALCRMGLQQIAPDVRARRCMAHPTKRRPMVEYNAALDYTAVAGALLTTRNLDDKIRDSRGLRRAGYRSLRPLTRGMKKGIRAYGALCRSVDDHLEKLCTLESADTRDPDAAADLFGAVLSDIFACGLPETEARIAAEIGRRTGRWIYLIDAADDLADDRKTGSYNPFSAATAEDGERLRLALALETAEIGKAVSLIGFADDGIRSLVDNIVTLGMPSVTERVIRKAFADEKTESE